MRPDIDAIEARAEQAAALGVLTGAVRDLRELIAYVRELEEQVQRYEHERRTWIHREGGE